jgi:TRAP-type mannitol/chloroaromatic compound transport system permease small subunit
VELPETRLSRFVDPLLLRVGRWTGYLWVFLLAIIVINVVLRYAFGEGRIEFEEIQWHLYSMGFLLGLGYALQTDAHIRVDVLHERFSPTLQAWVEFYGIVLFLLPFIALILIFSAPFVAASFELSEISNAPGGLPFRWAIKAMLPIGFILLLLAALARLSRVWAFLFSGADGTGDAD